MRWLRCVQCLLLLLEMVLNHMLVNKVMEVVHQSCVCVVVLDVVVHRGLSHGVIVQEMVMVMVMGSNWQAQHSQGAHRWGHWE